MRRSEKACVRWWHFNLKLVTAESGPREGKAEDPGKRLLQESRHPRTRSGASVEP